MRFEAVWLAAIFSIACAGGPAGPQAHNATPESRSNEDGSDSTPSEGGEAEPSDEGDIPHFEDGELVAHVSREGAARQGLTIVDLGNHWTPRIFEEHPELGPAGSQPFRERFLALANREGRDARRDPAKRFLELYGISPTIDLLHAQLADEERHACHAAIDTAPIAALDHSLRPGVDTRRARYQATAVRTLGERLNRVVEQRELASIDDLANDRRYRGDVERYRRLLPEVAAIQVVQGRLRCEGFLPRRARDGVFDAWTGRAIRFWQSQHMIISLAAQLDDASRATMAMDSMELDFLALLRSLRERVVDATGVIEDGTASNQWGLVLERQLNVDEEFRWVDRLDPLDNGAPDLVSQMTEATAQQLGWTDPEAALAWLNEHSPEPAEERLVAVRLPALPDYHSGQMDLRVEIDRGDVWYRFPYTDDGRPRGGRVVRRPTTTIFVRHGGREIPLVRWNTTIGGWQPELTPEGTVGLRYKESDVGERVWRDLIASPAWLPPPNTPDEELLSRSNGRWVPNNTITGPGYDSAYGMAMVIHHRIRGEDDWVDNGIRSHGSVSYRSILRGYSHGCHRLFNHLAVRMTSFLLAHRSHEVRGRIPASLRRELHPEPPEDAEEPVEVEPVVLEIDTRGFLYQLDPPVPVEVLRGNVRGRPDRAPVGFFPLPEELQAAAAEQMAEDPSVGGDATPAPGATP